MAKVRPVWIERVGLELARGMEVRADFEEQLQRFLGYDTRLRVHAFLKEHNIPLRCSLDDVEQDCLGS